MNIYQVVKKLIGSINPYGETHTDKRILDNLREHINLTECLVLDLVNSSKYRNRHEHSMKVISEKAYEELLVLKDIVEIELEREVN